MMDLDEIIRQENTLLTEGELYFRAYGLDCRLKRIDLGHLCGYVDVPKEFNVYQWTFEEVEREFHPHGGVTFDRLLDVDGKRVRRIGFDCAHAGDLVPRMRELLGIPRETDVGEYRNLLYVMMETALLAEEVRKRGRVRA